MFDPSICSCLELVHTVAQAAKKLSCSDKHILKLIADGRLRAFNLGTGPKSRTLRITEDELDRFVRESMTTPKQSPVIGLATRHQVRKSGQSVPGSSFRARLAAIRSKKGE